MVRYHYLIRGMEKAKEKSQLGKHHRMKKSYESLDQAVIDDLRLFLKFDDMAKKNSMVQNRSYMNKGDSHE